MDSTQYTEDWWNQRRGKVTASRCSTLLYGSVRQVEALVDKLAEEAKQPMPENLGKGAGVAAQWGLDKEEDAIRLYAFEQCVEISRPSFVDHPDFSDIAGCSPDFFANGGDILISGEVKCPYKIERFWSRVNGPLSRAEFAQIQWQLACSPDAEFAHYVVYSPKVSNPADRLHIRRENRDYDAQRLIRKKLELFNSICAGEAPAATTEIF